MFRIDQSMFAQQAQDAGGQRMRREMAAPLTVARWHFVPVQGIEMQAAMGKRMDMAGRLRRCPGQFRDRRRPQAAPDAVFFPAHEPDAALGVQMQVHLPVHMLYRCFARCVPGRSLLKGTGAMTPDRTGGAIGRAAASRGSQLHHGLVPHGRVGTDVDSGLCLLPEYAFTGIGQCMPASQHALYIAIENRCPGSKTKRGNGSCRGLSDARQGQNLIELLRKVALMLLHDVPCRLMQ